ncbi:Mobile element protein [Chondromyces apiculatus DSM 436]|uniref:Mobile element protein n=1 Tax=Chondromyces apiculatus DSM 436 TaxID=1192034 RepID=A0A017T8M4_9BACT|nr:Mobile element protein [Chondromyces apiculatus DSM 436]
MPDSLWERIQPLLPKPKPKPRGGRPAREDRAVLAGILFVLKTGIQWEHLPQEMGCGCGMTCWRRLRDWQEQGVWARLHQALLDELGQANAIDWDRASLDSASVHAKGGASRRARTPRTEASSARSITSLSTATASPSAPS